MGIPVLKRRHSWDRLIFNMGIPILVRRHLYIETGPWVSDSTKPLAEPMLTSHHWEPMAFTRGQLHRMYSKYKLLKCVTFNITTTSPRGQWLHCCISCTNVWEIPLSTTQPSIYHISAIFSILEAPCLIEAPLIYKCQTFFLLSLIKAPCWSTFNFLPLKSQ